MLTGKLNAISNLTVHRHIAPVAGTGQVAAGEFSADVRRFTGPTLIQINAPPECRLIGRIDRDVQPDSPEYPVYIDAKHLCKDTYDALEYEYEMDVVEHWDSNSIVLYEKDGADNVISTLRICLDTSSGLPITDYVSTTYNNLRQSGLSLAEPGRFVVDRKSKIFRRYVSIAYELGKLCGVDAHLLQVRSEHVEFYRRYCGARVIRNTPAPKGCTNLIWGLNDTPKHFFRIFGSYGPQLNQLLSTGESNDHRYL